MSGGLVTWPTPGYLGGAEHKEIPVVNPVQFIQQVRNEGAKIVWPTRREVITTTIMVLILSAITSIFFFLVDLGIRAALGFILTNVS
ncbi:preprotein translocase subunit SecE [Paracoccus pacificus]|uniref:Protein translocase subunit SecE n=1 Tax=Paracoccus pacificus TaxID=1463598 RepID=A0ABW4R8W2_9RHOB